MMTASPNGSSNIKDNSVSQDPSVSFTPSSPVIRPFPVSGSSLGSEKISLPPEAIGVRVKVPVPHTIPHPIPTPYSQGYVGTSNSFSPTFAPKSTRAASLASVAHLSLDPLGGGFSSSVGNSPSRFQRMRPGSSSSLGGGWTGPGDIWGNEFPPSDLARSPSLSKDTGSPYSNRGYLNSLHDSFLSRPGNLSEPFNPGFSRARTSTGTDFRPQIRNPMSSLKEESPFSDRRLSTSMSPMFGAPIDRSSLFRDYSGSPQFGSSLGQQDYDSDVPFLLNPTDYYRAGFARRMSLTPNFGPYAAPYDDLASQMETLTLEEYQHILNRRHSVAASAFPVRKPSQMEPDQFHAQPQSRLDTLEEDLDDQTEQFTLDLDLPETAKGARDSQAAETFYVVEFKINRTDVFYIATECTSVIKLGDKVIVQGDRGKDLGTVIREGMSIEDYKQEFGYFAAGPDGSQATKEVEPKKIYRLALPHEIAALPSKIDDEEKALQLVRTKATQREIYMKIVDAEYQWDRRKLTFYFVSDRRIDFRDLVRELFKIYKTRIWMCAVNR
ncbi:hypothetical protein DSO57_1018233 [Entomophthora muscae]|uniref:Uncharacterized protein n=1 Tax=Entomophthora muscae TaxID=34485 RepID=A0ACC2TRZ7_9FUNG|nr:hypothetical protein DSO57_1018233 [Entomophthora muscae]